MKRTLLPAVLSALGLAVLATPQWAQVSPTSPGRHEICDTHLIWKAKQVAAGGGIVGGCPTNGNCDIPFVRDASIPTPATPIKTVRLHFVVFAFDSGLAPAATPAGVEGQVAQLNADFLPHSIQFEHTMEIVNDTTYRNLANWEVAAMKAQYAVSPATQCNVYVTDLPGGLLGRGTFPWDADALTAQGGIICEGTVFGAFQETMTHEMGHNVGLWHTHHGVSEVASCSGCYEVASGVNGDTTGDFCSDTDPTPTNFGCGPPGGFDICSNSFWGATLTQNFMGYAGDACWNSFTPQQAGRMNCWIDVELESWLVPNLVAGDANGDGSVDLSDGIFLLTYLFMGGPAPDPLCIGDTDGDGGINLTDAIIIFNFLFQGGPPPVNTCP